MHPSIRCQSRPRRHIHRWYSASWRYRPSWFGCQSQHQLARPRGNVLSLPPKAEGLRWRYQCISRPWSFSFVREGDRRRRQLLHARTADGWQPWKKGKIYLWGRQNYSSFQIFLLRLFPQQIGTSRLRWCHQKSQCPSFGRVVQGNSPKDYYLWHQKGSWCWIDERCLLAAIQGCNCLLTDRPLPETGFLIYCDPNTFVSIADRFLHVGYFNIRGYNNFSIADWGEELNKPNIIGFPQLKELKEYIHLDVRNPPYI